MECALESHFTAPVKSIERSIVVHLRYIEVSSPVMNIASYMQEKDHRFQIAFRISALRFLKSAVLPSVFLPRIL